MLGKLIKHEFKATYKIFSLLFGALLILTLLSRFCVYIPFENIVFDIMKGILQIVYVVAVVCMSLFSVFIILRRFNTNMLRDEGYLMHTLPVKMWQQITAKTITYVVWMIATVFAMVISLIIYFIGEEPFGEILDGINKVINTLGKYHTLIPILILFVVLTIMQLAVNLLNIFAALSLGQIFAKHKIAGAILFYFVLNYALSFITSGAMMLFPNFMEKMDTLGVRLNEAKNVGETIAAIDGPITIYLLVLCVMEIVLGAIYFVITNYMLNKKLNLE